MELLCFSLGNIFLFVNGFGRSARKSVETVQGLPHFTQCLFSLDRSEVGLAESENPFF